jgi:hypothetical protein
MTGKIDEEFIKERKLKGNSETNEKKQTWAGGRALKHYKYSKRMIFELKTLNFNVIMAPK